MKLIIVMTFYLSLNFANAQNKITANLKSFDMCNIVKGETTNCKKGNNGVLLISTVEIEPNKKITIRLKDKSYLYSENWKPSSLSINDNNLFVYAITDEFLNCRIILNQNYSFIAIAHVIDYRNILTLVTAYD